MNRNGFTLIELLAVIGIIALIAVILISSISKTGSRTKQNLYNTKVKSLLKAQQMCEQDKEEDCDMISTLLSKKYIVGDNGSPCLNNCIKNPVDGTYLDNCFVVPGGVSCDTRVEGAVNTIKRLVKDEPDNTLNVITKQAPAGASCTNTLAYDGTVDNNLRYVGANPCNYVTFNNESWRIVGIMNNVDDGTGKQEARAKLVRATSLGSYSWDSSASTVNRGDGVNDWTQADLKNELNGDYLNTSLSANTNWYNGMSNQQTASFDYTKRINASSQNLIGDAKWHLGGIPRATFAETNTVYPTERGTQVWGSTSGQTCNDGTCPRATSWIGKVAIPYPSDFAFAVGEDVRNTCLGMYISYYYNNNCVQSQWITNYGLLITPSEQSASIVMNINGGLGSSNPSKALPVFPTLYLKSNVKITGGNGSPENPYTLG